MSEDGIRTRSSLSEMFASHTSSLWQIHSFILLVQSLHRWQSSENPLKTMWLHHTLGRYFPHLSHLYPFTFMLSLGNTIDHPIQFFSFLIRQRTGVHVRAIIWIPHTAVEQERDRFVTWPTALRKFIELTAETVPSDEILLVRIYHHLFAHFHNDLSLPITAFDRAERTAFIFTVFKLPNVAKE